MSKDLKRGHVPISVSSDDWPEEWRTVYYKSYPRLPKLRLPQSDLLDNAENALPNLFLSRRSNHSFEKKIITVNEISKLLRYSCGISAEKKEVKGNVHERKKALRVQSSAGSLFPIEAYILVCRADEGLVPGLYHYNVKMHALELLWEKQFSEDELKKYFVDTWEVGAAVIFFLTTVFKRTQSKYGERGYRHILLEAGHIGQNLYLVSEALGLGCCAIGGTYDTEIEHLLDIDGVKESLVYTLVVGHREKL